MSDDQLLLRVAFLYYRRDMTQSEVAERLGIGRVKVSRLLAAARERGIVRVEITHPLARVAELEYELQQRFGLREVAVAAVSETDQDQDVRLRAVAAAAAAYLRDLDPSPTLLGVSWGRTMSAIAGAIPDAWASGVTVVQLNGSISRSPTPTRADSIAGRIAEAGGGVAELLSAPAIVERPEIREALESDRAIAETLELARRAQVAIFSLGELSRDSVLAQSGYLDDGDMERLAAAGCVGDVLSRFIDADGAICDEPLDRRTVGLTLSELTAKPASIGVAAGAHKTAVARAAVVGGLVNVLIVDEQLAMELLAGAPAGDGVASVV